ncbi:MAG: response regulator [Chloroflexi bacterium]|nr:response regulator [Chloroflexota bacterium]
MNPTLRILIVDDDRRMARTLVDILTMSGYEVLEANSGAKALELIQERFFDCVLTDVKMPDMDGVELHRQLQQSQPGLPVVLMTAFASDDLINRGLDDGVVGVLDKPIDINHLLGFFNSLSKNRTIAIVDDDAEFCRTLDDILQRRGFKVTPITDPHLDVEQITADAEVILLDLKLNHISGLDILKEIRQHNPSLPVVLITGHGQEMAEIIREAMQINAFTLLYKPLEIPHLLQILADVQLRALRSLLRKR